MSQVGRKLISEKVTQLRKGLGLNREELSLQLGLDNSYISKLERCKVNIPIDRLEEIACFFKLSIKDFFN